MNERLRPKGSVGALIISVSLSLMDFKDTLYLSADQIGIVQHYLLDLLVDDSITLTLKVVDVT